MTTITSNKVALVNGRLEVTVEYIVCCECLPAFCRRQTVQFFASIGEDIPKKTALYIARHTQYIHEKFFEHLSTLADDAGDCTIQ